MLIRTLVVLSVALLAPARPQRLRGESRTYSVPLQKRQANPYTVDGVAQISVLKGMLSKAVQYVSLAHLSW